MLRHLRNVVAYTQQQRCQVKNKLSHFVRSISVNMSEQQQQQLNGTTTSAGAGATTAVTNGLAGGSDWRAGDLVKFMELVGNLKVSGWGVMRRTAVS